MSSIVEAIATFFNRLFDFIGDILQWILDGIIYVVALLIHDLELAVQGLILVIIGLANAAVTLMPACNTPTIDLTPFARSITSGGGTVASVICWVFPIGFLITLLGCMVNGVMVYLGISWMLRWLKVIK